MKKNLTIFFTLLLTAVLLYLFFRNADFGRIMESLKGARMDLILCALVIMFISLLIRAHRWRLLLGKPETGIYDLFSAIMAGFSISFLAPGRLGEFARPYILAKKYDFPVSEAFATVVLERIIDTLVILIMLSAFLILPGDITGTDISDEWTETLLYSGLTGLAVILIALSVIIFLTRKPAYAEKTVLFMSGFLSEKLSSKLAATAARFLSGFSSLRFDLNALFVFLESAVVWLLIALYNWLGFEAFGMGLPLAAMLLIIPVTAVGISVPTPGGVGGYHAVCGFALTAFFSIDKNTAVAATIAVHALSWIPISAAGLIFLLREGYSLSKLDVFRNQIESEKETVK